jgi:hypothetical protein
LSLLLERRFTCKDVEALLACPIELPDNPRKRKELDYF